MILHFYAGGAEWTDSFVRDFLTGATRLFEEVGEGSGEMGYVPY